MDLLILAAGKGSRIYKKIGINKCLLKVKDKTLLEKIISDAKSLSFVKKIKIVVGYKKENIINNLKFKNISFFNNKDYRKKEMLHSLYIGLKNCKNDTLITYSDIYFSKSILKLIYKKSNNQIIIPVQKNWRQIWKKRKKNFFNDCESLRYNKKKYLIEIGKKITSLSEVMGQYMGIIFIPKNKIKVITRFIERNKKDRKLQISQFLNRVIEDKMKIKCIITKKYWYEFDDYNDLKNFYKSNY